MNQRSRILLIVFAAVGLAVPVVKFVYPRWVQPLLEIDSRLNQRREALADLKELQQKAAKAAADYKDFMSRSGTFDIDRVSVNARDKLNQLIEKHQLQAESVAPSRPYDDKKTGLKSITINVKAVGQLEKVIAFLRDVSELPYLLRVGNVAMYPASGGRQERTVSRMNVRVPIELRVLPPNAKLVGKVDEKDLSPVESVVRHQGRDYSLIWSGTPFSDRLPPPPLKIALDKTQGIKVGQEFSLRATVTGGDGNYTYSWSGLGVLEPNNPHSRLDTAKLPVGEHEFTLAVADGGGQSAAATTKLNVKEMVVQNRDTRPPPPPPPPPDPRWKDRGVKQLVMMLGGADSARDELMVMDRKSGDSSYYKSGDEFDGGKLVFVHQTGGLVHRKDEFFVYPIGAQLDQDIPASSAGEYPELQRIWQTKRNEQPAPAPAGQPAAAGEPAGLGGDTVMAPQNAPSGPDGDVMGPTMEADAAQPGQATANSQVESAQPSAPEPRARPNPRGGRRGRVPPK